MRPIDFRNATFADLRSRLTGDRQRVLEAWREHGPCTTRQLAAKLEVDLLTVRPRTTELYQLGAVTLDDADGSVLSARSDREPNHEGIYRARTHHEWLEWHDHQRRAATNPQLQLV